MMMKMTVVAAWRLPVAVAVVVVVLPVAVVVTVPVVVGGSGDFAGNSAPPLSLHHFYLAIVVRIVGRTITDLVAN